jgi:hypothetical protein
VAVTQLSNTGAAVDLLIQQGADFQTQLTFTNADNSPLDLTGYTLSSLVRRRGLEAQTIATFVVEAQSPPTAGIATIGLPKAQTAAIACGETPADVDFQYVWDLKLVDGDGNVSVPLYGAVTIQRSVTR